MLAPNAPQPSQADQASVCKSTNELSNVFTNLKKCTNPTEQTRMNTFIQMATNPRTDFEQYNAIYNDLILSGDHMFGTMPNSTALQQVQERNNELKKQSEDIGKSIKEKEAVIERTDRDFIDTKQAAPEMKNTTVHVLDDYTLVVLLVAYVFFVMTIIVYYLKVTAFSIPSLLKIVSIAIILVALTLVLFIKFI